MKNKKIVIAPDSFKGTMSAIEVCDIVERAILKSMPDAIVEKMPVADGGEGTVDAWMMCVGGEKKTLRARGPYWDQVDAFYGVFDGGKTAVIEMAAASGLMLTGGKSDPLRATTYGTGELILDAAKSGCRRVVLGIGGSATIDGGVGAAAALGVRFLNKDNKPIQPTAEGLADICIIDTDSVAPELKGLEILIACDVKNTLTGKNGAAHVFGPQKGASASDVQIIDQNLHHLADVIRKTNGKDLEQVEGTGAAGGLALPLLAFFDAKLASGIDLLLDMTGFDNKIRDADLVITGEGSMDGQSAEGKAAVGVARRAKQKGVPVVALVGVVGDGYEAVYEEGISAIFATSKRGIPFEQVQRTAKEDLRFVAESLFVFEQVLEPRQAVKPPALDIQ